MASNFDAEEFIDEDFQNSPPTTTSTAAAETERAPTPEEVDVRVNDMQQKLMELKKAQQDLEQERAGLEELRRRQAEFSKGRTEMTQNLIRGIGLLEEAELETRRELEQLTKTLADFREALEKIQSIHEDSWSKEELDIELTRALTALENARMEWNSGLVKLPVLSATPKPESEEEKPMDGTTSLESFLKQQTYAEMCKMGLALTWPIALTGLAIFLVMLIR